MKNKNRLKKAFIFTLVLLPVALVGVYFAVRMSFASMESSMLDEVIAQIGSREAAMALSMIQPVILTLVFGFFGYIFSDKIGLMQPFRLEGKKLLITLAASLIGGAVFSLDAWTFAKWIPELSGSYDAAGSFDAVTWIGSILYGGVIEEVWMRLFLMSLLSFLAWKIFFRKRDAVPTGVLITANTIAAILFAAGHLPSTALTFGTLTPMLILRCFLMNGAFGLLFGRLYRKYGIQYAMLSHMLFHIVARTIWLIAF